MECDRETTSMSNGIEALLGEFKNLVIYGAGGVSRVACRLLKECCTGREICVAVTDLHGNPKSVEGFQVYAIGDLTSDRYKKDALLIIAMMPVAARELRERLHEAGYQNIITVGELVDGMYNELYDNPIQKGKILFVNFSGRGYGCNPKYICKEILERKWDDMDCVWAVNDEGYQFPLGIRTVPYGSFRYYYELATAQVWIDNQHKNYFSRKRDGQFYIQTWHGCGPLKKIEHDAQSLPSSYLELAELDMGMVDVCLSGAGFNSMLFRRAFRYNGEILECGCPRNDIFFDMGFSAAEIRTAIGIPKETSVILYAPTLRDGESNRIDVPYLLDACEKLFANHCVMLIREHPQMKMQPGRYTFSDNVINVSDYPDMQEILAVSDLLITDYSSVMWDFSLQKKPVFLYHPDVTVYGEERGIYIPFSEMPYIEAFTMNELYEKLCCYDDGLYRKKLDNFLGKYESFDCGEAAGAVVDRMGEVIKNEA